MKLKVKLLDQSVHEVDVDADTPISDLKAVLEAALHVPLNRQRLIYRGRVLRDENTLQELGVENGFTIHLVERPADADQRAQSAAPQPALDLNSVSVPAAAAACDHCGRTGCWTTAFMHIIITYCLHTPLQVSLRAWDDQRPFIAELSSTPH
eukprot:GHRQ01008157.1.p2 GENE.GHRQ01008157.1~~GHRQ01008157.1.p2  ORF type:complete len:152 (+),score=13.28 GHRQ01008157.1:224-679(+)